MNSNLFFAVDEAEKKNQGVALKFIFTYVFFVYDKKATSYPEVPKNYWSVACPSHYLSPWTRVKQVRSEDLLRYMRRNIDKQNKIKSLINRF